MDQNPLARHDAGLFEPRLSVTIGAAAAASSPIGGGTCAIAVAGAATYSA